MKQPLLYVVCDGCTFTPEGTVDQLLYTLIKAEEKPDDASYAFTEDGVLRYARYGIFGGITGREVNELVNQVRKRHGLPIPPGEET